MTQTVDLAPIGNGQVSALVDRQGRFVWACAPRVDSDPFFCGLLAGAELADDAIGFWSVEATG